MELEELESVGQSDSVRRDNNTPELVSQAAINTPSVAPQPVAEAGSGCRDGATQLAIAAFPKLTHAPDLQAVVAAAAREGGGEAG